MTLELAEGGGYFIVVDQSNQSIYVSWTILNEVIGTDDEYQYYGYTSTFLNDQKINMLASVGTVGGGINPGIDSVGDDPITLNSNPSASPNDDTPATTYSFALDGRRVAKAGAVDVKYLYDGDNVIYELWDDKEVRFTHPISKSGTGGCGAGHGSIFFTDHPISISIDGVKYYYLYDGLGSVTELIDENENVVNTYRYTPFGEALVRDETVYNPYQFTGRQYDAESGLYYYRARAYSADIGRFMQQDPAGMVDGANMYAYVGNNPLNKVDSTGMKSKFYCNLVAMWTISSWRDKYGLTGHGWQLHFSIGLYIARKGCSRSRVNTAMWRIEKWEHESGAASQRDVIAGLWGWHYQKSSGHPYAIAQGVIPLDGTGKEIITSGIGKKIYWRQTPPRYIR